MLRRETHRSRAVSSVLVASLAILTLGWLGTETVLHLLKQPALLASPAQMAAWLLNLPNNTLPIGLILAGIGIGLVGLALLVIALGSGRKPKRALSSERNALVVDDAVIASALARSASQLARVQTAQVFAQVQNGRAKVEVRPTSGISLDAQSIQHGLEQEVRSWQLAENLKLVVSINRQGAVGV
ncbi:hypothetical protein UM93_16180 [Psychromicrobium lacuslunae]|uniref:Uncharacterized protein n=2 Tax=Psychromicrobium lacuslunae TaxID=1618207 RepID=A0A0D4C3G8_9MICC|nr:hypothetical protein UM93_16180 [Psychromicrobium lacuslunae]